METIASVFPFLSSKRINAGIIAFFFSLQLFGQAVIKIPNMELKSAMYNTLIGSFSGSIGSLINKKKNEKWGPTLLRGFFVGSVGGSVMYCGKRLTGLMSHQNELAYAWLARAVYSSGNSIVENAASNRPYNAVWHFNIGFVRLEYNTVDKKLQPKILPCTMAGTFYLASKGTFDLDKTLRTGTPIFYTRVIQYDESIAAFTPTDGILYRTIDNPPETLIKNLNHEMVHTFQYQDLNFLNPFIKKQKETLNEQSKLYKRFNNWIYVDYSYQFMVGNYFLINRGGNGINYCYNFLENEAQFYATGKCACE